MTLPTSLLPDLSQRLETEEWMDGAEGLDEPLIRTLRDLRRVNRLLGGYASSDAVLDPLFRARDRLRLLDLGCGGGDYLCRFVRRGARLGCDVEAVGLDANPAIVKHARSVLDRELPPALRRRTRVEVGDALSPKIDSGAFDVSHAALFLHHFHGSETVQVLQNMERVSRIGLLVNDLHRHVVAYVGIWSLSRLLRMSPMVQHDGPISVRRAFHRSELDALARQARLPPSSIRWHWAFRWTLSTVPRYT